MNKISIGIDPGKDGFICLYMPKDDEFIFKEVPKIGKEVNLQALNGVFNTIEGLDCHCVIEDVHSVYGSSAKGTFEFGKIVGQLEAFLVAYKIPYTKVQPKKWQKEMWEGVPLQRVPSSTGKTIKTDTKKMSLLAANRLFPKIDLRKSERAKKPDHNKVDSLLICEYCKRKF